MKFKGKKYLNIKSLERLAIAVSLGVSLYSCWMSQRALDLDNERYSSDFTPILIVNNDSIELTFKLDKFNEHLQGVFFTLPSQIKTRPDVPSVIFEPNKTIRISSLEGMMNDYFSNVLVRAKDSTIVYDDIKLPVSIMFDCIVNRKARLFRQDHFLIFKAKTHGTQTEFTYIQVDSITHYHTHSTHTQAEI